MYKGSLLFCFFERKKKKKEEKVTYCENDSDIKNSTFSPSDFSYFTIFFISFIFNNGVTNIVKKILFLIFFFFLIISFRKWKLIK